MRVKSDVPPFHFSNLAQGGFPFSRGIPLFPQPPVQLQLAFPGVFLHDVQVVLCLLAPCSATTLNLRKQFAITLTLARLLLNRMQSCVTIFMTPCQFSIA